MLELSLTVCSPPPQLHLCFNTRKYTLRFTVPIKAVIGIDFLSLCNYIIFYGKCQCCLKVQYAQWFSIACMVFHYKRLNTCSHFMSRDICVSQIQIIIIDMRWLIDYFNYSNAINVCTVNECWLLDIFIQRLFVQNVSFILSTQIHLMQRCSLIKVAGTFVVADFYRIWVQQSKWKMNVKSLE